MAGEDGTGTVVVVVVADAAGGDGAAPDLGLVDALARLRLAARRAGCAVELREVRGDLARLLDAVGLREAVGCRRPAVDEARGQAEGGEELGVEEVVPGRDPAP